MGEISDLTFEEQTDAETGKIIPASNHLLPYYSPERDEVIFR